MREGGSVLREQLVEKTAAGITAESYEVWMV